AKAEQRRHSGYIEFFDSSAKVFRNRQVHKFKIAEHIRNSAIEECGAFEFFSPPIRADIPHQHEFREEVGINPRKCMTSDRNLLLNNCPCAFGDSVITCAAQSFNQCALA